MLAFSWIIIQVDKNSNCCSLLAFRLFALLGFKCCSVNCCRQLSLPVCILDKKGVALLGGGGYEISPSMVYILGKKFGNVCLCFDTFQGEILNGCCIEHLKQIGQLCEDPSHGELMGLCLLGSELSVSRKD